jgi:putative transcriptional regulator
MFCTSHAHGASPPEAGSRRKKGIEKLDPVPAGIESGLANAHFSDMSNNEQATIQGYLDRQLLIAMPDMSDPSFRRSVTLLCQHNDEGAIGITINRRSAFALGEIFQQMDIPCTDLAAGEVPVLAGGPVSPERGFVLHTPCEGYKSSLTVNEEIMVTTSHDILLDLATGNGPGRFVLALGYAGWGRGQLENEMRENAWLAVPADSDIVFNPPVEDRWERAVNRLGIDISSLHGEGGHA